MLKDRGSSNVRVARYNTSGRVIPANSEQALNFMIDSLVIQSILLGDQILEFKIADVFPLGIPEFHVLGRIPRALIGHHSHATFGLRIVRCHATI